MFKNEKHNIRIANELGTHSGWFKPATKHVEKVPANRRKNIIM